MGLEEYWILQSKNTAFIKMAKKPEYYKRDCMIG
jgi:hypothetical protein